MVECYGCVDVLVCNSSMKLKAPVQSVSLELDRNIMDINYFGPSTLAKGRDKLCLGRSLVGDGIADNYYSQLVMFSVTGILPTMISRRSGHILLVNSIQGRLAVPFRSSCELSY